MIPPADADDAATHEAVFHHAEELGKRVRLRMRGRGGGKGDGGHDGICKRLHPWFAARPFRTVARCGAFFLIRAHCTLARRCRLRRPHSTAMPHHQADEAGNNILPLMPALDGIFAAPAVDRALRGLLGEGYCMHPHR